MPAHTFLPLRRILGEPRGADPLHLRVTSFGEENPRGEFVLYWAQSARRLRNNPALNLAIRKANERKLPLVVYESLRPDYVAANDRIHTFILGGVVDNAADAEARGLRYHFFLPKTAAEARGALVKLAGRARLVVTDEFPTKMLQEQTARFVAKCGVAVDLVDGNGILPMRAFAKEQYSARFLRDRAHRMFPELWLPTLEEQAECPRAAGEIDLPQFDGADPRAAAAACAIDHSVAPVASAGGRSAGLRALERFVGDGLAGYATRRNKEMRHTSGLSPYLHFGFVGIQEVAERVLFSDAPGEDIDSFLEEAIIRRELSFNMCFYNGDHDSLAALPRWARDTLDAHRSDRRKPVYSLDELESAATYDEVWNLSQRQLLATGTIHGYLRMLWGKKIIEWSETPEDAHRAMVTLHDRYAIDGRDPNTHAGILWCFGKHDRPWAPQRPIFGMVRWMSSEQTAKKVRLS